MFCVYVDIAMAICFLYIMQVPPPPPTTSAYNVIPHTRKRLVYIRVWIFFKLVERDP